MEGYLDMKRSKAKALLSILTLAPLMFCFQNCAEPVPASSDTSILAAYPNIHSLEPAGGVQVDGDWIRCTGVCAINFHSSENGVGGFTSIDCGGDLLISDKKISCSNNLSASAAQ
jgi:hypothetical protein